MDKTLEDALRTIHFALVGYCEDSISSELDEQEKIYKAYETVLKAVDQTQIKNT
jgi:hypothetical protein